MRTNLFLLPLVAASLSATACRDLGEDDELTYEEVEETDEELDGGASDDLDGACAADEGEAELPDLDEYSRDVPDPAAQDDCAAPHGGLFQIAVTALGITAAFSYPTDPATAPR